MELKKRKQKLRLIYLLSLKLLLLLSLSACATNPPDVPICVELAPDRGRCVQIMSGKEIPVDEVNKFEGKTWWEARPTMIQMPSSSWTQIKGFIIKMCTKYKTCDKDVSSWDRTIQTVDKTIELKQ